MEKFSQDIIQYFNDHEVDLDQPSQDAFWKTFLTWKLQACYDENKKMKIQKALNQLTYCLDIKEIIKVSNFESNLQDLWNLTEPQLIAYLVFAYYSLQFNHQYCFQDIYQQLIQIANRHEGYQLLAYCYQKTVCYILKYFDKPDIFLIDLILAYSLGCYALVPDPDHLNNLHQTIIDFLVHLKQLDFYQKVKHQNFFVWDLDDKYQIVSLIIDELPLKDKKCRYLHLVGKKFQKQ